MGRVGKKEGVGLEMGGTLTFTKYDFQLQCSVYFAAFRKIKRNNELK